MGKRNKLLTLFRTICDRVDDQAAYMDYIYETRDPSIGLDYETKLFGNVPRYKANHPSYSYFEYDTVYKRFRNRETHHFPSVLHFPGKNNRQRKSMYYHLRCHMKRFLILFGISIILMFTVYVVLIFVIRSTVVVKR